MKTIETTEMTKVEFKLNHLFNERIWLTDIREFGLSWQELLAGAVNIPKQGARFDILFEGSVDGPYLKGIKKGVDYLLVRSDGQYIINLKAEITTPEGERIAVQENGLMVPAEDGSPVGQLQLSMQFITASKRYAWLNSIHVWGNGKVDLLNGEVSVSAYKG